MQPSVKLQSQEALMKFFAACSGWAGLRQEPKDVSAYHFDITKTFHELRTKFRRTEKQHTKPPFEKLKPTAFKSAQERDKEKAKEDKQDKAGYERLETMIQQIPPSFPLRLMDLERRRPEQRPA